MKHILICAAMVYGVTSYPLKSVASASSILECREQPVSKPKHFKGAFSNGMKGDSLSFDLSADGKTITNLLFKGYWRCNGKLEQQRGVGPDGTFKVVNGKVDGHISEPPDGGSTAWRFDLNATIIGSKASGTFRMNINNLGCDTYLLKFEAAAQ